MIKIFGFNILRDWEFEKLTDQNWEKTKKLLKIDKLYRIKWIWESKPKCPNCDEDRKIEVTLPDGSKTKVSCSCAKSKISYGLDMVKDNLYFILRKNGKVWLSDGLNDYSIYQKIICKESQLENEQLDHCYYTSKKLAEKALKLFKKKEELKQDD